MRLANWGSALLFSSALGACGGSTSGGPLGDDGGDSGLPGEGGGNVTAEQACGAAATSLCTRVSTCAPFISTLIFGDTATCIDAYTHACLASVNAGNTGA